MFVSHIMFVLPYVVIFNLPKHRFTFGKQTNENVTYGRGVQYENVTYDRGVEYENVTYDRGVQYENVTYDRGVQYENVTYD